MNQLNQKYSTLKEQREIPKPLERNKEEREILREWIFKKGKFEKTEVAIPKEIKKDSPYSDEINKYIRSKEELEIYKKLDLQEGNDKPVLKDNNIDPNLKDSSGRTNLERMKQGLPPLDKDGSPYNLHHIGQEKDSPLAELPDKTHKENDKILHDKSKPSEIDRGSFAKERAEHWKARAEEIETQQGAKND